jgi:hypothetical protein
MYLQRMQLSLTTYVDHRDPPEGRNGADLLTSDTSLGTPLPGYLERIVAAAEAAGFPLEVSGWRAG